MRVFSLLLIAVFLFAINCHAQQWRTNTGWDELQTGYGNSLPNGSGLDIAQVEAPTVDGGYVPANNGSLFSTVTFINVSNLSDLDSPHATSVGSRFYGNTQSIIRGGVNAHFYEVNDWVNDKLGFLGQSDPVIQPYLVQNHSWIANAGISNSQATSILARSDYSANENNLSVIVGANNGSNSETPQLMAHGYNAITVGRTDGNHSRTTTRFYGSGRQKPEIVAPESVTSFTTPIVSSSATLLKTIAAGTDAEENEVIKSLILAGATKTEFPDWSISSDIPLDDVFGVGELNIFNSYQIFLGGETDGQASFPMEPTGANGWDFGTINSGSSFSYLIELQEPADHVSVVLTWNIAVEDLNNNPTLFTPGTSLSDLDLIFSGTSGAELSTSSNHNIEHIYARNLPAGNYLIVVDSSGLNPDPTVDYALAWRSATLNDASAESVSVLQGVNSNGSLTDLQTSDGVFYELRPEASSANQEFLSTIELETTCPVDMANSIQIDVDGLVSTPNIMQEVELFNFVTGVYDSVSSDALSTSQAEVSAYVNGEVLDYVDDSTRKLRARIRWRASGPVLQYPWTVRLDRVQWQISQ
ncbi:MAG: hypothetical protein AAGA30_11100 [Planctomycetota bacterium]